MTSRERVRLSLQHKEADRVPIDLSSRSSAIEEQAYDELKRYLGIETPTRTFLRAHAELEDDVMERLHIDTKFIRSIPSDSWADDGEDRLYIDRWRVPWRKQAQQFYYELDASPLQGLSHSEVFEREWPDLVSDEMMEEMVAQAEYLHQHTDYALFSDVIATSIFERAWYLRGFEDFLMDMMLEKTFVHRFLEKILERQIEGYQKLLDNIGDYIDGIWMADDLAAQNTLLLSPKTYREMVKPYQKQLIEFIQARGVKVIYHSCGAIYPLLPDLIDIGVQVFHPIQLSAKGMADTQRLKQEFGQDLVFWGGGCEIEILQYGTVTDVECEVKRRLTDLAPGGGFVFTPTHCIQPKTPPENILAMIDAVEKYGNYS